MVEVMMKRLSRNVLNREEEQAACGKQGEPLIVERLKSKERTKLTKVFVQETELNIDHGIEEDEAYPVRPIGPKQNVTGTLPCNHVKACRSHSLLYGVPSQICFGCIWNVQQKQIYERRPPC